LFPETISPDTNRLIQKIKNRTWLSPYYLAGGTALALHLGHRTSIDLDFFSESEVEEMTMLDYLRTAGNCINFHQPFYAFRVRILEANE
jgi:hypothetical protein